MCIIYAMRTDIHTCGNVQRMELKNEADGPGGGVGDGEGGERVLSTML